MLTHNSWEFVNDGILRLCEPLNTILHTAEAKSPWSSGLVENQNLVLSEILNQVSEEVVVSLKFHLHRV